MTFSDGIIKLSGWLIKGIGNDNDNSTEGNKSGLH